MSAGVVQLIAVGAQDLVSDHAGYEIEDGIGGSLI